MKWKKHLSDFNQQLLRKFLLKDPQNEKNRKKSQLKNSFGWVFVKDVMVSEKETGDEGTIGAKDEEKGWLHFYCLFITNYCVSTDTNWVEGNLRNRNLTRGESCEFSEFKSIKFCKEKFNYKNLECAIH